ncbi:MAG: tetraacyldisaccharide 4'-kinase, partial [Candidatus Aminicenantes bacterium]|nr:tetraacyldisaccharide 4'-kinase [Candidatus Aminicenantes bacterium]
VLRPERAPLPVISVGNLSFGGTGKTPLALAILSHLAGLGLKPALVSRGYKGRWERRGGVLPPGGDEAGFWRDAGDEPALAAKKLPGVGVFVGKRRIASCLRAKDAGFQVVVLDDGFQHRRLHRDLDIVLFDPCESSFLRESPSSLGRADLVLVRDGRPAGRAARFTTPDRLDSFRTVEDGVLRPDGIAVSVRDGLQGKKVLAFCGIARPERFFDLLEASGARIAGRLSFPDHFAYPPGARAKIESAYAATGADLAVTTEKDAVKLDPPDGFPAGFPLFVLRIKIELPDRVRERIRQTLSAHGLGKEPWPESKA